MTEVVLATSSAAKVTVIKTEEQDQTSSTEASETEPLTTAADESSDMTTTTFSPIIYVNSTTPSWTRLTSPTTAFILTNSLTSQPAKATSISQISGQETYFTSQPTNMYGNSTVGSTTIPIHSTLEGEPQKQSNTVESSSLSPDFITTVSDNVIHTVSPTLFATTSVIKYSPPVQFETERSSELVFSTTSEFQGMDYDEGLSGSPSYCALPCPAGYKEGPSFCYNIVPITMSTTYKRALGYCQMDEYSDLARKQDFLDESVVTIARHLRWAIDSIFGIWEAGSFSTLLKVALVK
ncbi:hypothetical protein ANCDUO_09002 [Ancylostoma duodenale]|uniref:Uncharacterized protein n=1 Tax=Ancylostoma duodenale TaxID=51022 RepID=A0A0C2GHQ8_9BILA|nr:hypothetical protein ANCDUO_09002 [Ancylostoma duodenale]